MVYYSVVSAGDSPIVSAWGHDGDGLERIDPKRSPDFPPFKLPETGRADRHRAIAAIFKPNGGGPILVGFDDMRGEAMAWRMMDDPRRKPPAHTPAGPHFNPGRGA